MSLIKVLTDGIKREQEAGRLRQDWYKKEIVQAFEDRDFERGVKMQVDVNNMHWGEYESFQEGELNGYDFRTGMAE